MKISLQKRNPLPWWGKILLPLGAIVVSILFSSLIIVLTGANPAKAWYYIFWGSIGTQFALLETIVKMAPLVFTGLACALAFRAQFWNIGAEGQLYAGCFGAALLGALPLDLPAFLYIPLVLAGGFVAGGIWGVIPGILKVKYNANDIVTTLLSNYIIIYLLEALLEGAWRDPQSGWPHSPLINDSARFPILIPRSRLHLGIVLALLAAVVVYLLMQKTILGYQIKVVGENPRAAFFGGIPTGKIVVITALLSGGLAGLAGVGEVCAIQYYLVGGMAASYGYFGIAVAMLGGLNPFGVILGAFYFAIIMTGAQVMSRMTGVPVYLADIIQGVTLLALLFMMPFDHYRIKIRF